MDKKFYRRIKSEKFNEFLTFEKYYLKITNIFLEKGLILKNPKIILIKWSETVLNSKFSAYRYVMHINLFEMSNSSLSLWGDKRKFARKKEKSLTRNKTKLQSSNENCVTYRLWNLFSFIHFMWCVCVATSSLNS